MSARSVIQRKAELLSAARAVGMVLIMAMVCAACDQSKPRSVDDFRDDVIARDGALARCNQDRKAALTDIDCSNARRAAAAAAIADEDARSAELQRESERKLAALRERDALRQEAESRAVAEVHAAAQAAYDAQWLDPRAQPQQPDSLRSGLDPDAVPTRAEK